MNKKELVKILDQYKAYRFANHPIADVIDRALDTLSDEEEQIIKLAYMSKKRQFEFEICAEMGMCDRSVRRRKASALEKLGIALTNLEANQR